MRVNVSSREKGHDIIETLRDTAKCYGYATLDDLFSLVNCEPPANHPDLTLFGWQESEIEKFRVVYNQIYNHHDIDFPDAKPLAADDTKPSASDMVNHPSHYKSETGIECIDAIEAATFDLKGIEAVDTANVLKYIWRWKRKNGLEDLKKARWYLDNLIAHVEKMNKESK